MKQFIITVVLTVLAILLVPYITGDTDSLKSEGTRIGTEMITDLKTVNGN